MPKKATASIVREHISNSIGRSLNVTCFVIFLFVLFCFVIFVLSKCILLETLAYPLSQVMN